LSLSWGSHCVPIPEKSMYITSATYGEVLKLYYFNDGPCAFGQITSTNVFFFLQRVLMLLLGLLFLISTLQIVFLTAFFPILHFSVILNCHKNVIIQLIAYGWYGTSKDPVWYDMNLPTHHLAMSRTSHFYEILSISFTVYSEKHFVEQKIRNLMSELRQRAKTKILNLIVDTFSCI
jgi:hypothetical protein